MGKRRIGVSVGCFKDRPTNPRTKMVSSSSSSSDDDHGLALKLQKLPSCNTNMEPLLPPHHHDHGGGPLFCCRSSSNPVSSSSVPDYGLLPATAADVFPVVSKSNHSTEEMSAAAVTSVRESARSTTSFPFTPAQLQELERQTMILNYLMASLPVPPHLIPNMVRNSLELGISTTTTGHSDPEPWRCKRTDGKKWRCSRDVAPDQKYCERHSHKSRPRSRKPVEFHTMTTNPLHRHLNHKPNLQGLTAPSYLPFFPNADAAMPPYEQPRNLEWFLKGETNAVHGWNHLRKGEKDSSQLQCEWLGNDDHYNSWFYNLPKSTSVDAAAVALSQGQETRHFLDAWSTTIRDKSNIIGTDREKGSPVSSADKALPLTLSMYGGGGGSESTETSYEEVEGNGHLGMRNQWLPHCSWPMSSPPGGPLAEALCLGISSDGSKSPPNFTSGMNSSFANKW